MWQKHEKIIRFAGLCFVRRDCVTAKSIPSSFITERRCKKDTPRVRMNAYLKIKIKLKKKRLHPAFTLNEVLFLHFSSKIIFSL